MKQFKIFGSVFVVLGVLSFFMSFISITGFVTSEDVGQIRTAGGIILIIIGAALIYIGRDGRDLNYHGGARHKYGRKGASNSAEMHRAARESYIGDHGGNKPSGKELRR